MNLTTQTYNRENAAACAMASSLAYSAATVCGVATDTQCLVRESADHVVIAFRGTNDLRKFITDGEFFRTLLVEGANGGRCLVHRGFLAACEDIIGPLMLYLNRIVAGSRPVFVTGHSLGGALAILAALELKRQGFNIQQVYTFGQPRVGNNAFKNFYESCDGSGPSPQPSPPLGGRGSETAALGHSTFRVVYQEDIVARIPHLPEIGDPYRHVGTEVFLPCDCGTVSGGREIIAPGWAMLLWSDAWGLYRAWRARGMPGIMDETLADHHISNYMQAFQVTDQPSGTNDL